MKEFFVGLFFLAVVAIFAGIWFLFFPLLLLAGLMLRFILMVIFIIFAIWVLGKMIIVVWGKLKP